MGVAKVVFSGPFSDPPRGLFPRLRAFTRRKHILLYFKRFSYLEIEIETEIEMEIEI